MNLHRQTAFIIHVLYLILLAILLYLFFHTMIYIMLPFLIGFFIAFLLRPLVRNVATHYHHEKVWAILIITAFYVCIVSTCIILCLKGFAYLQQMIKELPAIYSQQIEPFINQMLDSWSLMHEEQPKLMLIFDSLNTSVSAFIERFSSSFMTMLSQAATSLPNMLFTFSMALLSSFFFTMDYHTITAFIYRQLPMRLRLIVNASHQHIRASIGLYILAYGKLMIITFIQLLIGFVILDIEHPARIAFAISLFDFFPVLGTGGIIIPWMIIAYLTMQPKLACGLLILMLTITLLRNILEPRIVGKQFGLHPLLMLISMYIGARVFGFMGMLCAPFIIMLIRELNEEGVIQLYH